MTVVRKSNYSKKIREALEIKQAKSNEDIQLLHVHCVISPNFLEYKFCGKAQFPQSFHTRKLGRIVLY